MYNINQRYINLKSSMYINFITDRKTLGYEVLRDTSCGMKLVLIIDSTISLKKIPSKFNYKSKRVIVGITLVSTLWLSNVEAAPAMGLSLAAAPVVRLQSSYRHSYKVKTAPIVRPRLDKIVMTSHKHMIPLIYLNGHYSYINEQLLKRLRSGDLSANLTIVAIGVVIYVMCQFSGVDAFTILKQIG